MNLRLLKHGTSWRSTRQSLAAISWMLPDRRVAEQHGHFPIAL
jgi:hypothetical protein